MFIYMFMGILVMAVVGRIKYEMTGNLKIRKTFNDRFFGFMSIVLSLILAAIMVINVTGLERFLVSRLGVDGNADFEILAGCWFLTMFIPFLYGVVLYGVGKFVSMVWYGHLREKRAWLNGIDKISKKK